MWPSAVTQNRFPSAVLPAAAQFCLEGLVDPEPTPDDLGTTDPEEPFLGVAGGAGAREAPLCVVEPVRLSARMMRTVHEELDAQGVPAGHPIRAVLGERWYHARVLVSRAGRTITGALAYDPSDKKGSVLYLLDVCSIGPGQEATAMVRHVAQEAAAQKKTLVVPDAPESAVPFYQRLGVEFSVTRTRGRRPALVFKGRWDDAAVAALAAGTPIDKRIDLAVPPTQSALELPAVAS